MNNIQICISQKKNTTIKEISQAVNPFLDSSTSECVDIGGCDWYTHLYVCIF